MTYGMHKDLPRRLSFEVSRDKPYPIDHNPK